MRYFFLICILIIPFFSFSQKKDYRNYDKAIESFNNQDFEKAKKFIRKCILNNITWEKPYQLLGKIYESEGDIELAIKNYYKGFDPQNPIDHMWWKRIADLYFSNGVFSETCSWYFPSGNLMRIKEYSSKLNYQIDFHENGEKKSEGAFDENDLFHNNIGKWTFYDAKGKIVLEKDY